jgi:hypothetical protein
MSFKKNNYLIIKNVISKELSDFIYVYFINKREVAKILFDQKYISPFETMFGVWTDSTSSEYIFTLCRYCYGNFIIKSKINNGKSY